MKKFYISNLDGLSEYEKQNKNHISYRRLCDRLFSSMILCNEIANQYPQLNEQFYCDYEDDEDYLEIYQYYIVDGWSLEDVKENLKDVILLEYLEELDLWILGVTHYGTSWDYVLTDLQATTNINDDIV